MKKVLFVLVAIISVLNGLARPIVIYGSLTDPITHKTLFNAVAVLKSKEGNPLDTMLVGTAGNIGDTKDVWGFQIEVKGKELDYKVEFSHTGYETKEIDIKAHVTGRKTFYNIGLVELRKSRDKVLQGASIKASKVMFYTKNDTVIYNADAFQLDEGSMLDALIRQLPGVELKDDGRIYQNGKYVERLLLNGEDFFKGKNDIMLENLPSYMVQNIKTYDKVGKKSEFAGKDMDDIEFVMDVRLKKQYSIGWIGNAEAGYGSNDLYLGRLFAMRFTPQSHVSLFGNINNINETRKPEGNGDWTPEEMTRGRNATKRAGLDYMVKDHGERWEFSGNANVSHDDNVGQMRQLKTNFFDGGNTFARTNQQNVDKKTSLSTSHNLNFKNKYQSLWLMPSYSYTHQRNFSNCSSVTATRNLFDDPVLCDKLVQPTLSETLWKDVITRSIYERFGESTSWIAGLSSNFWQKFKNNDDMLCFKLNLSYGEEGNRRYDHNLYERKDMSSIMSDFQNRYKRTGPTKYSTISPSLEYWYWLPFNLAVVPKYNYRFSTYKTGYNTYRLESLEGFGAELPLGILPSMVDYLTDTKDNNNSYQQDSYESEHTPELFAKWEGSFGNGPWLRVQFGLPVRLAKHHMDYQRGSTDTVFSKTMTFFEPNFEFRCGTDSHHLKIKYEVKGTFPNMANYVSFINDENPLSRTIGGKNLKKSYTYNASIEFQSGDQANSRFFSLQTKYSKTSNMMALAKMFNRTTGVTTYRMENVNGNYNANANINFSMPLDRVKRLTLNSTTSYSFYHNADLIGEEHGDDKSFVTSSPQKSIVKTHLLDENIRMTYRFGKNNVGLRLSGTWHNANSRRSDFSTINAGNFRYGAFAQIQLPWQIQLTTDLNMYSRRGYASHEMNTNDFVWNARLSKRCCNNRLTFIVECFDMLHQLSSRTFTVNGQGQTETWQNVLPSYVMAHLIYKLNVKPKKRPGE